LIICAAAIVAYGAIISALGVPDHMEKRFTTRPCWTGTSGWAATHFAFWALMGFWFPGNYVQALAVSFLWEGAEDLAGSSKWLASMCQRHGVVDAKTGEPMRWYARYTTDGFYNLAGYIVGSALAGKYWPRECVQV
jgi:hypothetical protein